MNQVKETIIGFLIGIGIYGFLIELVGVFFSENLAYYSFGLLFGIVVSILLIFHIVYTLDKALDMPQGQATKYTRKQSFLRLFFMLIAMVVALMVEQFNFIAVLLGMLGLKIGAFIAPHVLRRLYPEDFVTKPE